jgi:putative flippase GtrA
MKSFIRPNGYFKFKIFLENSHTQFLKFIICGLINFFCSYLIYLFLLIFVHYQIAFLLSFISGILISSCLNISFTFSQKMSRKLFIQLCTLYLVQYIFSFFLLWFFVNVFCCNQRMAPFILVIVCAPINFLLNRKIILGSYL